MSESIGLNPEPVAGAGQETYNAAENVSSESTSADGPIDQVEESAGELWSYVSDGYLTAQDAIKSSLNGLEQSGIGTGDDFYSSANDGVQTDNENSERYNAVEINPPDGITLE